MLIIQCSHRKNGNSAVAAAKLAQITNGSSEILHLADFVINHFDYDGPGDDDFLLAIEAVIQHDEVVFVTPIYWYTMSGMAKVFLDRISDLLKWNKPLGRKLRGRKIHVISVSGHDDAPEAFPYPFKLTAAYLGMNFGLYIHLWGDEGILDQDAFHRLDDFASRLLAGN